MDDDAELIAAAVAAQLAWEDAHEAAQNLVPAMRDAYERAHRHIEIVEGKEFVVSFQQALHKARVERIRAREEMG